MSRIHEHDPQQGSTIQAGPEIFATQSEMIASIDLQIANLNEIKETQTVVEERMGTLTQINERLVEKNKVLSERVELLMSMIDQNTAAQLSGFGSSTTQETNRASAESKGFFSKKVEQLRRTKTGRRLATAAGVVALLGAGYATAKATDDEKISGLTVTAATLTNDHEEDKNNSDSQQADKSEEVDQQNHQPNFYQRIPNGDELGSNTPQSIISLKADNNREFDVEMRRISDRPNAFNDLQVSHAGNRQVDLGNKFDPDTINWIDAAEGVRLGGQNDRGYALAFANGAQGHMPAAERSDNYNDQLKIMNSIFTDEDTKYAMTRINGTWVNTFQTSENGVFNTTENMDNIRVLTINPGNGSYETIYVKVTADESGKICLNIIKRVPTTPETPDTPDIPGIPTPPTPPEIPPTPPTPPEIPPIEIPDKNPEPLPGPGGPGAGGSPEEGMDPENDSDDTGYGPGDTVPVPDEDPNPPAPEPEPTPTPTPDEEVPAPPAPVPPSDNGGPGVPNN